MPFRPKETGFTSDVPDVVGAALEDVVLYASTSIPIGDYQHDLPVVVVACVEELTRTGEKHPVSFLRTNMLTGLSGIYQSGLFRALPNRDRHLQLIDIFDKSEDLGIHFSMRGQAMPDICALLSTFISSLPNPLVEPNIYSALWQWCVKPSVKREDARRQEEEEEEEDRRARGSPPRTASTHPRERDDIRLSADRELEGDQLCIAQILLRLLPISSLSLLIYLCGFFTQLPLCPDNGIQFEDVARIFGPRLLGGTSKVVSQKMMAWLLLRWQQVSEAMFSDNCGMSSPSSPVERPESPSRGREDQQPRTSELGEKRKVASGSSSESPSNRDPSDWPDDCCPSIRRTSSSEEDNEPAENHRRKSRIRSLPMHRHHSRKDRSGECRTFAIEMGHF